MPHSRRRLLSVAKWSSVVLAVAAFMAVICGGVWWWWLRRYDDLEAARRSYQESRLPLGIAWGTAQFDLLGLHKGATKDDADVLLKRCGFRCRIPAGPSPQWSGTVSVWERDYPEASLDLLIHEAIWLLFNQSGGLDQARCIVQGKAWELNKFEDRELP